MSGPTVKFTVDLRPRQARTAVAPPLPRRATKSRPAAEPSAPTAPVSTAARTLALAHFIEREVRSGRFTGYRDAARRLGISHTRIGHITTLVYLPAAIQCDVLLSRHHVGERALRRAARHAVWPT